VVQRLFSASVNAPAVVAAQLSINEIWIRS
jgi:hypothetical protein